VTVKVADFGLAREARMTEQLTFYVSTRWYRAPEIILHSLYYDESIDMFAVGLLLSELFSLRPLLPGSSEIDQIHKMVELLGPPTEQSWKEGLRLMNKMNFRLASSILPISGTTPPSKQIVDDATTSNEQIEASLRKTIHGRSDTAANLIRMLIQWNPSSRLSAKEALHHEFLLSVVEKENRPTTTSQPLPHQLNQIPIYPSGKATAGNAKENLNDAIHIPQQGVPDDNHFLPNYSTRVPRALANSSKLPSKAEQENEFCSYLTAVTSSSKGKDDQMRSTKPRVGTIRSFKTPGKQRRQSMLQEQPLGEDTTPRAGNGSIHYVTTSSTRLDRINRVNVTDTGRTIKGSIRKRSKNIFNHGRGRANMGRRAIEVEIHKSIPDLTGDESKVHHTNERCGDTREDRVWNPFQV
jgi:serine/threonine protein kinase